MRKKIMIWGVVICLACAVLSVTGCTRGAEDNAGSSSGGSIGAMDSRGQDDITMSMISLFPSVGNMGLFYRDEKDMLHFTDAHTGKSSIVCDRANCAHESYWKNRDTKCKANVHAFEIMIQQGKSMYLLGKDDEKEDSNYRIYRQDLNGSHRKQVAELQDTMDLTIPECWSNETYLVMKCQQVTASNSDEREEKLLIGEYNWGILVYEWETGEFSRCILSEEKLDQVSNTGAMEGMTFGEDGFSVCLTCQDTGFDAEETEKLPDDKVRPYWDEHRNIHYVAFRWDDPEKIAVDRTVVKGGWMGAKYRWNRLYYIDTSGKIFLMDFSDGEEPVPQEIVLKDVQGIGKDTLIQLGAIDPEGRLYYTATTKKARWFYYYDPAAQESFPVCDGSELTIEGGSSDYMVLVDTSKVKITFHQLSFEDFRETGLEKLGGTGQK